MNNGFNPLRWNCRQSGCYNEKLRPRIERFASSLPGRIAFSDVDATVEVGGRFLFLEWKSPGAKVSIGQEIYHKKLTALSPRITSVIVEGDPANMEVSSIRVIRGGKWGMREPASFQSLSSRIQRWSSAAKAESA